MSSQYPYSSSISSQPQLDATHIGLVPPNAPVYDVTQPVCSQPHQTGNYYSMQYNSN